MARIDASGAEKGNVSELNSITVTPVIGSFSSDTTVARSGTRSWHSAIIGATSLLDNAFGTMQIPGTNPINYSVLMCCYIDPDTGLTTGTSDINIFRLRHGAGDGDIIGRVLLSNGAATCTLIVTATDGITPRTVSFSLSTATFHIIHVRCSIDTTLLATDTWAVRVNGIEQIGTAVNFASAGLASIDFGINGQNDLLNLATSLDIFFDDIIIDNTNSGTNTIPDSSFLQYIEPNGDLQTGWGTVGAGATHSARLSDEDDETGITSSTDANIDRVTFNDISDTGPAGSTNVIAVYTSTIDQKINNIDIAGDYILRHQLAASDGTDTTITTTNSTTSTIRRSIHVRNTAPDGAAWSIAKVNDLRVRLESDIGLTESVRINELWSYAEVQVAIQLTETPALEDQINSINATLSLGENISIEDVIQIIVTMALEDVVTITDTLGIFVTIAIVDVVAVDDSISINVTLSVSDVMPITETPSVYVTTALVDLLQIVEQTNINVIVNLTEEIPETSSLVRIKYVPEGSSSATLNKGILSGGKL